MAKKPQVLYSVSKTFVWFAIISIILTGCLVGIVWTDYNREWKDYQKKFVALKLKKTREEIKAVEASLDKAKVAELQKELADAEKEFASHRQDYKKLQDEIERLGTRIAKTRTQYQTLKQYQDSYRYYFEEYSNHKDPKAASYKKKLDEITPKVSQWKINVDALEKDRDQKTQALQDYELKEKDLKRSLDKVLADKTRLEKRAEKLKPSIVNDVLNAPMLDFVAPSLRVQQIVLENLQDDYHFAKVQKVDRCTTCHLGIDQKGFEDAPQPFKTHPKLDLYLGSASAHPIEKIGCTVCHGGNGHSVSFLDTAHTPKDEIQEKEWVKKYQWHELEKWEHKMLPSQNIQAACAKCHREAVEVPQADKLNEGRQLARTMGCLNCHKVSGFENSWKVGPDLSNIQNKLDADWIEKWLDDPKSFRPSTKMPQIFHLSNADSPEDHARDQAAIKSISAYLLKNSESVELSAPSAKGSSENGEKLVKTLGCLACHSAAGVDASHFGPELSGLGSKVSPEWLYTWLKNPKHYSPNTRMPDLRLSDQEASDITAYLLSQKNEPFEKTASIQADPKVVDELILTNLESNLSKKEAQDELQKMSSEEKLLYLGKKSISHQGCYTCHTIKGFEDAKPIGAELSNEGRKDIHQFDFGFVKIPHTRQSFISQKIKNPRIYDEGKIKGYYEKLRMPQFHFTEQENEALTTFILSLSEEQMPLEVQKRLSSKELEIEKGRLLVSKVNCNGCHTLDGKNGTIRDITEDPGQNPPVLDGEGAKVQEKWLHDFLKSPTPIRPWINYRMPTFGFSSEELTTLNKYFNNLSNEEISYSGIILPETTAEKLEAGHKLFDTFQCAKCHQVTQESAAMGSSFLAPDLAMAKDRLKPEWVSKWILDPQALQEGTMMPGFFPDGQTPMEEVLGGDAHAQIDAIRDYLYRQEAASPKPQSQEKQA